MPKLLVIDDADDIRRLIKTYLEKQGHTVVTADSARAGLAELLAARFDLVLLDLEMPGVDGAACLAAIRMSAFATSARVLMVTATPIREVLLRVVKLGVEGVVIKSGDWLPALLQQVNKTLAEPAPQCEQPAAAPKAAAPPGAVPTRESPTAASPARPAKAHALEPWSAPTLQEGDNELTMEQALEMLKSLKPIIARSELLETMLAETVGARALKPAVQQVLRLTENPESSIQQIANAIRQDQALSLRILRIANSPLYTRGDHVDSVAKAVSRIGLGQIHSVVLSASVLDTFSPATTDGAIRQDWFWEHATACGLLATRLCEAAGRPRGECETAFTTGLLHDLGRLLYAEHLPEHYPKVIQTADELQLPLEAVESRLLLLNHAEITERLLRDWKFPASFIGPVAYHHETLAGLKAKAPKAVGEIAPLVLANRVSHALLMGSSGNEMLSPIEDLVASLGIEPAEFAALCLKAQQDLADLRTTMLMHAGTPGQPYIEAVRERLDGVRPLVLAVEPATDPVSLMCTVLSGGNKPDNPSVILLRISAQSERARAAALVAAATEELSQWSDGEVLLPVLVIGNTKACLLSADALPKHKVAQVTLPISINRLFRRIRLHCQS